MASSVRRATPAPVRARGLVKRYEEVLAVDHIDLNVRAGDVYGFLGPNGAGKTTTLRMALGLIMPTEGMVELFGRDPMRDGARALEGVAGFVEAPRFYPYLTRPQEPRAARRARRRRRAKQRIGEVLDTVELTPRAAHRVGGFSHGMRQRLGIAAALLRRPRLLILDEPATGLDPAGHARHAPAHPAPGRRGHHRAALQPPAARGAGAVRPRRDRQTGRVVYEGALADLRRQGGAGYRLRTTDDARALELARTHAGIERAQPPSTGSPSRPRSATSASSRSRSAAPASASSRSRPSSPRSRTCSSGSPRDSAPSERERTSPRRTGRGPAAPSWCRPDEQRRRRRAARRARRGAGRVAAPLRRSTVYRWELRKLVSQKRTYLGLALAVALPLIFVIVERLRHRHDRGGDTIFASEITQSGLATPVLMLLFLSAFMLPLIASLVAGDIVANEDGNGTLKTILTRSVDRGQVFAAKALAAMTYAAIAVFLSAAVATVAGVAAWGFHSITTLLRHGRLRPEALLLVFAANACLPDPAAHRRQHRRAALDRHAQQRRRGRRHDRRRDPALIVSQIPGLEGLHPYLLTEQFRDLAGPAAHAHRLGADRALGVGLRAVRGAVAVRRLPRVPAPRRRRRLRPGAAGRCGTSAASGKIPHPHAVQVTSAGSSTTDSSTSPISRRASRGSISPAPRRAVDSAPQATPKRRHWSGARPS